MNESIPPSDDEVSRLIVSLMRDVGLAFTSTDFGNADVLRQFERRGASLCRWAPPLFHHQSPIHFRYLARDEINAVCGSGIIDFVAVSYGTVPVLWRTFLRMLCHPSVFPEVGNASLESHVVEQGIIPTRIKDIDWRVDGNQQVPKCPVRAAFASLLASAAFDWLVGHEIGHIVRGHFLLESEVQAKGFRLRFEFAMGERGNGLTSQVLENDADAAAALLTIHGAFDRRDQLSSGIKFGEDSTHEAAVIGFGTSQRGIETTTFAVWTLLRLMEQTSEAPLESRSHPPLPIRRELFATSTYAFLKIPSSPIPIDQVHPIIVKAVSAADQALHQMALCPFVWNLTSHPMSGDAC